MKIEESIITSDYEAGPPGPLVWTLERAVALCIRVESIAPQFHCHVGLTGGTLYKGGKRKDCDLVFYRIRQAKCIEWKKMFVALNAAGILKARWPKLAHHWIMKADTPDGLPVDCFFPDFSTAARTRAALAQADGYV